MTTAHVDNPVQAVEYYRTLVRSIVAQRKCILAMGPVGGASSWVKLLRELGAEPPLILTDGPLSSTFSIREATCCSVVREPSPDMRTALRKYVEGLQSPPPEVLSVIESFDPDRRAIVLVSDLIDLDTVATRQRYDLRPREWIDLEDKTVIDSFWDVAGIQRVPARVIVPEVAVAKKVTDELDQGLGTAWAGDVRDGSHYGAILFRWVRTEEELRAACEFFSGHCDFVRIMPFLEGLPCSIHGMVFPNEVAVFRPVEIIVLRRNGSSKLLYAGTASFWDPSPADRNSMRLVARAVGETLKRLVNYRGFFNVDGILTAGGFMPTELNTRMGAGGVLLGASLPDLPLILLDMAVRRAENWDFRPSILENLILNAADARRSGGGICQSDALCFSITKIAIVDDGTIARPILKGEIAEGWITVGPSGGGSFVSFNAASDHTPIGLPLAPRLVRAFAIADQMFETRIGTLEAARLIR